MEKFALLDVLKAFERLSGNVGAKPAENNPEPTATDGVAPPEQTASPSSAPSAATDHTPRKNDGYPINVMANVLARHEVISNRIKNKR